MKCPLRLRGISILGGGPGSDAGGSSGSTEAEVRLSQATLTFSSYAATDCEVEALFFFWFFFPKDFFFFLKTDIA